MAMVMAVASHLRLPLSHPMMWTMSQDELALFGAQMEREEKTMDERFGILAMVGSQGRLAPEDVFYRLHDCVAQPATEEQYEHDVSIWARGI